MVSVSGLIGHPKTKRVYDQEDEVYESERSQTLDNGGILVFF